MPTLKMLLGGLGACFALVETVLVCRERLCSSMLFGCWSKFDHIRSLYEDVLFTVVGLAGLPLFCSGFVARLNRSQRQRCLVELAVAGFFLTALLGFFVPAVTTLWMKGWRDALVRAYFDAVTFVPMVMGSLWARSYLRRLQGT